MQSPPRAPQGQYRFTLFTHLFDRQLHSRIERPVVRWRAHPIPHQRIVGARSPIMGSCSKSVKSPAFVLAPRANGAQRSAWTWTEEAHLKNVSLALFLS